MSARGCPPTRSGVSTFSGQQNRTATAAGTAAVSGRTRAYLDAITHPRDWLARLGPDAVAGAAGLPGVVAEALRAHPLIVLGSPVLRALVESVDEPARMSPVASRRPGGLLRNPWSPPGEPAPFDQPAGALAPATLVFGDAVIDWAPALDAAPVSLVALTLARGSSADGQASMMGLAWAADPTGDWVPAQVSVVREGARINPVAPPQGLTCLVGATDLALMVCFASGSAARTTPLPVPADIRSDIDGVFEYPDPELAEALEG